MEEEFKRLESEDKWTQQFELLFKKSRRHSADIGDLASNKNLNRYLDVLPYDRSRIKLSRIGDNDYINANLVTVPKAARQYILTQGPLLETVSHFWLMAWEQKTNVIVMLNKCIEMEEFVKCEQYWPESTGSKLEFPDVKLSVTLIKVDEEKHFTKRELLLEDHAPHKNQKNRTILQFQYKAWPDYDEPDSPTSFLRLLAAIRKSGGLDKMDEPTIVHCSAGIGRSGTFCLIDSILSMVENQGSTEGIDIMNTLLEMRDHRMGLIQSAVQLRFAYMSIIYGIKILENANKLHPHMSSMTSVDKVQRVNGSPAPPANGKKQRRNKKKQGSTNNSPSLNVFNRHQLVEALDDIGSDTADNLFEDAMKHLPSLKKARNSAPDDLNENLMNQLHQCSKALGQSNSADKNEDQSSESKAQMLTNAINSLLAGNTIAQQTNSQIDSQNSDSVLLRRREREVLKNERLAKKTQDIVNRMKIEEARKEIRAQRMALYKKSAIYGGVAILLSSIAYLYLHGNA